MSRLREFLSPMFAATVLVGAIAATTQGANAYPTKSIRLIIGAAVGGSYDISARLVGRFLERHIPGNPGIVIENMPGASSLVAANYIYNIAPQDGSVLGVLEPTTVVFGQLFGDRNARFNIDRFQWIGNPIYASSVPVVWYKSPVKDWESARSTAARMGAPSSSGPDAMVIHLVNNVLGTKFAVVTGYEGGSALSIAMERGEIDGRGSGTWGLWKSEKPDWVEQKKIIPLLQIAHAGDLDLANVPLLSEIVKGDANKKMVSVYSDVISLGRPMVVGPTVPAETVTTLRQAFEDTMNDPDFLAEERRLKLEPGAMSGTEIQSIVHQAVSLNADSRATLRQVLGSKN